MQRKEPLKQILASTRLFWDRPQTRRAVVKNFEKVLKCRTEALGAEVFASENEQKVVPHTCKSRACPSCGHRATNLWQRQMWALLPEVQYAGVVFTMPDVLWPIFLENRHLLDDLPALGAAVIQEWAKEVYGVRLLIMVVGHTFGRHLNFNPHLHVLASAGGLRIEDGEWISGWKFDRSALMRRWRFAVIAYLREACRRMLLRSDATPSGMRKLLRTQYERWWNVDVQPCTSKGHFLRYAGRYVRRPPVAQYRFLEHTDLKHSFRKAKKENKSRYDFIHLIGREMGSGQSGSVAFGS